MNGKANRLLQVVSPVLLKSTCPHEIRHFDRVGFPGKISILMRHEANIYQNILFFFLIRAAYL